MNRREFLGAAVAASIVVRAAGTRAAASRTFEVITRIALEHSHDAAAAWVPLPLARMSAYQTDRGHSVAGNADKTRVEWLPGSGAAVLVAEWNNMMPQPELIVTTRVETTGHAVSLTAPG